MSTEEAAASIDILRDAYRGRFGALEGGFLVTAPGRINLMGDHIDYAGLPVLPMAIQRRVSALCTPSDGPRVRLANTQSRFAPREFRIEAAIEPFDAGDWGNYAKAAAQALVDRFPIRRGIEAVVQSDIPVAAGLSSSSALVVAFALALLRANEIEVDRLELAELLAEGERYVGTRGGGMDQAICLAAEPGTASRVEFGPLRVTPVPVPLEWRFVVADSGVRAEKAGGASSPYNARTEEAHLALATVAANLGESLDAGGDDPIDYRRLVASDDVGDLLGAAKGILDPVLFRRFRHVITEGRRVRDAERALRAGDMAAFGRLMLQSHVSLRDDFEVSHPALDRLVEISQRAGAAGARLTGAGLGGCVIALCGERAVEAVSRALRDGFYAIDDEAPAADDALFTAVPASAARIEKFEE